MKRFYINLEDRIFKDDDICFDADGIRFNVVPTIRKNRYNSREMTMTGPYVCTCKVDGTIIEIRDELKTYSGVLQWISNIEEWFNEAKARYGNK